MNGPDVTAAKRHQPRLVLSHDVHEKVHAGRSGRCGSRTLFAALAAVSFPAAIASGDVIVIVAWIAQTFLQLVMLPIIEGQTRILQQLQANQGP